MARPSTGIVYSQDYSPFHEHLAFHIDMTNKELSLSSADNWEHFRRADLLQEALHNMRMGNLSVGLTIWVQHQVQYTCTYIYVMSL